MRTLNDYFLHAAIADMGLLRLMTQMKYKNFFSGMAPAQLLAFSTSSSGATLPVTMERCEEELGVSEEVSSFVLPLGAATNERAPEPLVFIIWSAEPSDVGKVKLLIVVALIAHLPFPSNVMASPDALFDRT